MTGDTTRGDPAGDQPTPSWVWIAFSTGLGIALFGVLILVMGALMSETGTPRSGDFVKVTQYRVSPWLFWLGGACIVVGTLLSWPGYRATFGPGAWAPLPPSSVKAIAAITVVVSLLALPVALVAAPDSGLRWEAYLVTGFLWLMLLGGGTAAAVAHARERSQRTDDDDRSDPTCDVPLGAAADEASAGPTHPVERRFGSGADDPRRRTERDRQDLRRRWPPG